jgi:hypothetical protein
VFHQDHIDSTSGVYSPAAPTPGTTSNGRALGIAATLVAKLVLGRDFHSSPTQLNLSRLCH